jgi:formate hydrogenlyase transcriptional activator
VSQADLGSAIRAGTNGRRVSALTFDRVGDARGAGPALAAVAPGDFSMVLTDLSDRLLNASPERTPHVFRESLERLAWTLGVDRCALAEFTSDGRSLTWTQGFAMPGIPQWPALNLSARLPWYTEQVKEGRTLLLPRLPEGLPPEARAEAELIASIGLKSHLTLPLKAGGGVLGCLGLASFRAFPTWHPELVASLVLLAGVFASALLRRQADERLRAAEDVSRSLRDEVRELKDRLEADTAYLQKEVMHAQGFDEIVGVSAALSKVLQQIEQVAAADSPVLILGETGTGKDLVARAIHDRSRRENRPLVAVNCAALPDALIESELFGYEKGAFTGAVARTLGRFEMAHGGSILLDEVGELPLGVQAKLLRVLEGGTFERLGSAKTITVDVRVIAATNRDLAREVRDGRFRADLYYRLNVFPLTVPPLRDRAEDVPLLVWHFINARQGALGRTIKRVPERLMRAMEAYAWPGNVRELENVIERALIVSSGPSLEIDAPFLEAMAGGTAVGTRLDDVQRAHIEAVLRQCGWRLAGKGNAAERLGLKRGTLQFRMKKLGIRRPDAEPWAPVPACEQARPPRGPAAPPPER